MACEVGDGGCQVCPGMWLAGLLLAVAIVQALFSWGSTSREERTDSSAAVGEAQTTER